MAAPSSTPTDRPVSVRNLTIVVCIVGFLDLFGVSMIIPLIQSHAKQLGASPSLAGLVGSVYGFLQLFSSPIMGKWSDLIGHRLALVWCLLLSGCGYVLLGMSSSIAFLTLARIPSGLFKHSQTISKAYLAEVIPPEKRASVYGQFNAVSSIGFIVGPTVGGHLAESFSSGFFFVGILAGVVFIISSAIVKFSLPNGEDRNHEQQKSSAPQAQPSTMFLVKDILKSFAHVDWENLWDLFLVNFLLGFASIMLKANFTRMLIDNFQTTPKINGYVISFGAIISTVSSFGVGKISKFYETDAKLYFHAAILTLSGLIGMTFAANLKTFVLLQAPLSLSSAINRVVAANLMVERGGRSEAGGLMGLNQSLMAVARTMSPFLSGLLLELFPLGPVLGACVSVGLGIVVMYFTCQGKSTVKVKES